MSTQALVQDWFVTTPVAPGVTIISEPLHVEDVRSFLIEGRDRAILLDTGMGISDIAALARSLTELPVEIVNSHAHWDHIGGNWRFSSISIHPAEADCLAERATVAQMQTRFAPSELLGPLPAWVDLAQLEIPPSAATQLVDEGDRLDLGGRTLTVWHTPGHSPGGIVLVDELNGILFSTDVVYPGMLYAFGSDADWSAYRRTVSRLAACADELALVLPSHNGPTMERSLLRHIDHAFDLIDAGRSPDECRGERVIHRFGAFSVAVSALRQSSQEQA